MITISITKINFYITVFLTLQLSVNKALMSKLTLYCDENIGAGSDNLVTKVILWEIFKRNVQKGVFAY